MVINLEDKYDGKNVNLMDLRFFIFGCVGKELIKIIIFRCWV